MVGHAEPSLAHLVAILHSQLRSIRPRACYAWQAACIFPAGPIANAPPLHPTGPKDVRQRFMPYVPQATIVKSTTSRNGAAARVPLQSIVRTAISMA